VNDRHVLSAAVRGQANAIVTLNHRDFPEECLKQYDLLRHTPDDFLIHQYHLNPVFVLQKLDEQASALREERTNLLERLKRVAPQFVELIQPKPQDQESGKL